MQPDTLIKPTTIADAIAELWRVRDATDGHQWSGTAPKGGQVNSVLAEQANTAASQRIAILEDMATLLAPHDQSDALVLATFAFDRARGPRDARPAVAAADDAALIRLLASLVLFLERQAGTTVAELGLSAYFSPDTAHWPRLSGIAVEAAERLTAQHTSRQANGTGIECARPRLS